MNILYINHYAGSISMGMEFRPYYLAREWEKLGHNVRIIGADFSHLRKQNPVVSRDFEIQEIEGVTYQWIKTRSYQGNGVKRAITMFQFCFKLWWNAKKIVKDFKPDVVISSSTYPLDTYPAQRIAKIAKAKYIHEGHDIWPLTLTELSGMPKWNPFVIALSIAEKSAYKKCDKFVSLLPFVYKHALKRGLQCKEKFVHISNGVVLSDWENPKELPSEHRLVMEKLRNEGKKIVCYLGGHAHSNALDTLVDAALSSAGKSVAFVLIGNGDQKERLKEKSKAADNIYFLPPVEKSVIPTVFSMVDCVYVGAKKCRLYEYGVSLNKVYDYMMSGKPIIYGVESANNEIEDFKCGITVEAESVDALKNGVEKMFKFSHAELKKMGENGRKAVMENFNYTVLAKKFIDVVEGI